MEQSAGDRPDDGPDCDGAGRPALLVSHPRRQNPRTVAAEVLTPYADGNMFCPTIRYTTREGQTLEYDSDICAWPPAYAEDQQVTVYYDRANPKHVQLDSLFGNWFIPGLFGVLGILLSVSGISMFSSEFILARILRKNQG